MKYYLEVKNASDWSLLIGHMLGVDHCGHTFGSLTPHIGRKLSEIDDFIDEVIDTVDNDTIVLAFGDHGMTISGDHGGESEHETDAALYVYAPKQSLQNIILTYPFPFIRFYLGHFSWVTLIGKLCDNCFWRSVR